MKNLKRFRLERKEYAKALMALSGVTEEHRVEHFWEDSLLHDIVNQAGVMHWFEEVKERPMSIEEVEGRGYYIDPFGDVCYTDEEIISDPNHVSSEERAVGLMALGQLLELRDAWNEGETPDSFEIHFVIKYRIRSIGVEYTGGPLFGHPLRFRDEETAEEFLDQFQDLIETASPVLS